MSRFAGFVSDKLIRYRVALLAMAVLLGAICLQPAQRLALNRDLVALFADSDPLMPPFERLLQLFGNNGVVLAVYDDPEFFDSSAKGIRRLTITRQRLGAVDGVKGTFALDSFLQDDERIVETDDRMAMRIRELFEGFTHGEDQRTVCIACILTTEASGGMQRQRVVARLRRVMNDLPDGLAPGVVAGEPVMMSDAFEFLEDDGDRLFKTSTLLLGIVILLCFRSVRWVIVPIAVVQLALLYTKAILYWSSIELTMVSSVLTAIVTVVGVATVVHVIIRFRDARSQGLDPQAAMRQCGRQLVVPVFWACVTDAVGFASLMVADVKPVRDFGYMMAVGSLCVLASAAMAIPGLALLGRFDSDPKRAWGEGLIDQQLFYWADWIRRRPLLVSALATAIAAFSIVGIRWLETETDFTRNFRDDTELVQSYELVEAKLGGAGLFDVIIPAPRSLDWTYLSKVLRFEHRLREEVQVIDEDNRAAPGLTKVISLADTIYSLSPSDLSKARRRRRQLMINTGLRTMRRKTPEMVDSFYIKGTEDQHYFRIMLRALERQPSTNKREIIRQVNDIANEEFSESSDQSEVTGFFVLLTSLIDSVLRDQWRTFSVALLGIGFTMLLAFRSPRLALVALIPNGIPILMVTGVMGWLGLRVNMGGAMIAAVSVGLSIDSSIHYITSFRRERNQGKSVQEALDAVQGSVGRAVVFSTLALIVGFAVLCTSQLIPIVYFGVLVSIAMLGGLVGNLIILPMLLRMVSRDTAPQ